MPLQYSYYGSYGRYIMFISRKPSGTAKWYAEWRIAKVDKRFMRRSARISGEYTATFAIDQTFNNWLIGWLRDGSNDNGALFKVIKLHYWVSSEMRLTGVHDLKESRIGQLTDKCNGTIHFALFISSFFNEILLVWNEPEIVFTDSATVLL